MREQDFTDINENRMGKLEILKINFTHITFVGKG